MPLMTHSTSIPGLLFGGGNLFDEEVLAQFDGLLAFVYAMHPPGLHFMAMDALEKGRIECPHVLYGADCFQSGKTTLGSLPALVWKGLDELSSYGCRNIGFHGAKVANARYVDGARTCLRAICEWIERNPGKIDRITLVDIEDDYYTRFGEAGFLARRGIVTTPPGNDFEEWFESGFLGAITETVHGLGYSEFPYHPAVAVSNGFRWPGEEDVDLFYHDNSVFRSVAAFYISLIPQAVAKATGKMDAMCAFARCANWPLVLCGLGGHMSPYEIIMETNALPAERDWQFWAQVAEGETGFFGQITRSIILANLWNPVPSIYRSLRLLAELHINDIVAEIGNETKRYAAFFRGEGPQPGNYYIEEWNLG